MTKSFTQFFGKRLKNIRERKNISIEELSSFTGLYKEDIKNLEEGKGEKINIDNWKQIIQKLEFTLLDYENYNS